MQLFLGSGQTVFDRANSHIHEDALKLLPSALMRISLETGEMFAVEQVDFGHTIGQSTCVQTISSDQIIFAQRRGRRGLTRFVLGRKPEETSCMVVILKKDEIEDYYVLITAFVGRKAEPEPWDRNSNPNSVPFWDTHALIWGTEQIIPGTETTECPW